MQFWGKEAVWYENEKETEMVSGAFEEKTFLLSSDPDTNLVPDLFYFIEKHCFRGAERSFAIDESDRRAPYHFQEG